MIIRRRCSETDWCCCQMCWGFTGAVAIVIRRRKCYADPLLVHVRGSENVITQAKHSNDRMSVFPLTSNLVPMWGPASSVCRRPERKISIQWYISGGTGSGIGPTTAQRHSSADWGRKSPTTTGILPFARDELEFDNLTIFNGNLRRLNLVGSRKLNKCKRCHVGALSQPESTQYSPPPMKLPSTREPPACQSYDASLSVAHCQRRQQ